jgi:protein-S-isoprenylcysteine O-methyltransferase Ste14
MIKSNRILISRIAGAAFIAVLLVTGSAHANTVGGSLLFMLGSMLVGVGAVGRLWCSLYINGYKNAAIIDQGPYSISRNPLYLFSFIGAAGIGFATETLTLGIGLSLLFLVMYPFVIGHEEEFLEAKFGDAFRRYVARTPRFFPNPRGLTEPESYTVDVKAFRRSMGDALWFVWVLGVLEVVKAIHQHGILQPWVWLP